MGTKKLNLPSVYIFQNTCQTTYFRSQWLACLTQERTIHSYGVRRNTDGISASTSRMRQLIDNWLINRLYPQSTRCLRCVDDSDFWRIAPWPRSCLQSGRGSAQKDREGRPEMDIRSPRRRPEIRKDTKWKGTSWDTLRYQLLIIFLVAFVALNCVTSPLQKRNNTLLTIFWVTFFGQDVLMAWSMQLWMSFPDSRDPGQIGPTYSSATFMEFLREAIAILDTWKEKQQIFCWGGPCWCQASSRLGARWPVDQKLFDVALKHSLSTSPRWLDCHPGSKTAVLPHSPKKTQ